MRHLTCVGQVKSCGDTSSSWDITAALGLLAGGAYAVLHPPMFTSTALVLLPQNGQAAQNRAAASTNGGPDPYTVTQEVIAKSNPVLQGALHDVRPAMSVIELGHEVETGSTTPYIISISAKEKLLPMRWQLLMLSLRVISDISVRQAARPGNFGRIAPAGDK